MTAVPGTTDPSTSERFRWLEQVRDQQARRERIRALRQELDRREANMAILVSPQTMRARAAGSCEKPEGDPAVTSPNAATISEEN